MKKLIIVFIISSLAKGVLLFVTILSEDIIPSVHILLRYLIFLILIIDWRILKAINTEIIKMRWIKLTAFLFGTYVLILWITGPLFELYNYIYSIQYEDEANMPKEVIVGFLLMGLIITSITTTIWIRNNNFPTSVSHNKEL